MVFIFAIEMNFNIADVYKETNRLRGVVHGLKEIAPE